MRCSQCGVSGREGGSYSLMDSTKSEKMPTTCHRRMSQNTTVSLVSGGGLGLGGAVLGCGSEEKGLSQAEARAWDWAERGRGLSKDSAQAFQNLLQSRVLGIHDQSPRPWEVPDLEKERRAEPQNHGAGDSECEGG